MEVVESGWRWVRVGVPHFIVMETMPMQERIDSLVIVNDSGNKCLAICVENKLVFLTCHIP